MGSAQFLIELVLILISARVVGEIFSYFKIPSVLGELTAGIILGPTVFGLIETSTILGILAQIGIVLLLFEVGIETDFGKLVASGGRACLVASGGVVVPFVLGFFVSYHWLHFSLIASFCVASALTATSIGITLRVLQDLKKQKSPESQIVIGAAVLDDIIGIVLLAILYEFAVSSVIDWVHALKVLMFIALFFIVSPIAVKGITFFMKRLEEKTEGVGLIPTMTLSLILFFAFLAHSLGAPELLGGFAAGIALSKKFSIPFLKSLNQGVKFSHRIEEQMKPIVHLFAPIFFVSIGVSLNLRSIAWGSSSIWTGTALLLVVATVGKLASGWMLWKESWKTRWVIGISMVPRGEVGLIFANLGRSVGMIEEDLYMVLILVIAATTLIAPLALKKFIGDIHR